MNTHSHAFFTFAALQGTEGAGLAVAGSVFPDALYYLAVPAIAARRGLSYRAAQTEVYRVPALKQAVDAIHSVPVLLLVSLLVGHFCPAMLMFCLGWASHLAIDLVTHGKGAHPHFWPILPWRFESPISFYEEDRFGRAFMAVEHGLMAGILAVWWQRGVIGPESLAGLFHHAGALLLTGFAIATLVAYVIHLRQRSAGAIRRGAGLVAALGI